MNIIMRILFLLLVCFSAFASSISEKAANDEVELIPNDDPDMAKAMKLARETLEEFLRIYRKPKKTQTKFAVKIGISEGEKKEFFWVNRFKEVGNDEFLGTINNEPRLVSNVKYGQQYRFKKIQIVDWTYMLGETMKGNYTACAILKHSPKEQQEEFKRLYGLKCNL